MTRFWQKISICWKPLSHKSCVTLLRYSIFFNRVKLSQNHIVSLLNVVFTAQRNDVTASLSVHQRRTRALGFTLSTGPSLPPLPLLRILYSPSFAFSSSHLLLGFSPSPLRSRPLKYSWRSAVSSPRAVWGRRGPSGNRIRCILASVSPVVLIFLSINWPQHSRHRLYAKSASLRCDSKLFHSPDRQLQKLLSPKLPYGSV